jgi:hypothetical protein
MTRLRQERLPRHRVPGLGELGRCRPPARAGRRESKRLVRDQYIGIPVIDHNRSTGFRASGVDWTLPSRLPWSRSGSGSGASVRVQAVREPADHELGREGEGAAPERCDVRRAFEYESIVVYFCPKQNHSFKKRIDDGESSQNTPQYSSI